MKGKVLKRPAFADDKPDRPSVVPRGSRAGKVRASRGLPQPDVDAEERPKRRRDREAVVKAARRQRRNQPNEKARRRQQ